MDYRTRVKDKLNNLIQNFATSSKEQRGNEFDELYKYLKEEPIISSILTDLLRRYDTSELVSHLLEPIPNRGFFGKKMEFEKHKFSSNEERISYLYLVIHKKYELIKSKGKRGYNLIYYLIPGGNLSKASSDFTKVYLKPIYEYLINCIEEVDLILYLLLKYKQRVEWFTWMKLSKEYNDAEKQYEELLENDLRLFLFDQGIDYPFSTPKSSTGRADIVGLLNTNNPLIVEIKIVDSKKGYGKKRVINGFAQIYNYTNDYNKNIGYLVIYNLESQKISFEFCDENDVPFLSYNERSYYFIVIDLNRDKSASKIGKLKEMKISKSDLTDVI